MDIDTIRVRALLDRRDEIDAELVAIFSGSPAKKPIRCGHCGKDGHSARSCPERHVQSP